MSFLKKALLTAVVAAVGLAGTVVAPSPANAASAGTVTFSGEIITPPLEMSPYPANGGGIAFWSEYACVEATSGPGLAVTAGQCRVDAGGSMWGNCDNAGGELSGSVTLSSGQSIGFYTTFWLTGRTFTATGVTAHGEITIAGQLLEADCRRSQFDATVVLRGI